MVNGVADDKTPNQGNETNVDHWQINKGMQKFFNLPYPKQQFQVVTLLNSEPELNPDESQKALQNWKKFSPLTLDDIIKNSNLKIDFDNAGIEYKQIVDTEGEYVSTGQFKKGTEDEQGIGREVSNENDVYEG